MIVVIDAQGREMSTRVVDMLENNGLALYNSLRRKGWRVLWAGEHMVCMIKR